MLISELSENRLKIIAKTNPEWVSENRPDVEVVVQDAGADVVPNHIEAALLAYDVKQAMQGMNKPSFF